MMGEPAKVMPPKRPGRPKAEEPSTTITAWIPVSQYDRICRLAQQRDQTVSALVKSLLILRLK